MNLFNSLSFFAAAGGYLRIFSIPFIFKWFLSWIIKYAFLHLREFTCLLDNSGYLSTEFSTVLAEPKLL